MEELKEKRKKSILKKTWDRCKSFGHVQTPKLPFNPTTTATTRPMLLTTRPIIKSKSWSSFCSPAPSYCSSPRSGKRVMFKKLGEDKIVVPHGCFSVYVGPDRQRFVIKVECTSHPLFKMLLEEAELEYGYHSDGPLMLPCEVEIFIKVLAEMDGDLKDISRLRCSFSKSRNPYHLLSPPRLLVSSHQ